MIVEYFISAGGDSEHPSKKTVDLTLDHMVGELARIPKDVTGAVSTFLVEQMQGAVRASVLKLTTAKYVLVREWKPISWYTHVLNVYERVVFDCIVRKTCTATKCQIAGVEHFQE